ncbi:Hypothetical predicted protein [Octopus vulgaris]|uniref:Uncharacterized protein n=1 Tax=Octopus vulgaris TaxID=6645 RepID=A0AA36AYF1_OCTVU|nr:Hypothetical predicted protein [Octopus vulgaris]
MKDKLDFGWIWTRNASNGFGPDTKTEECLDLVSDNSACPCVQIDYDSSTIKFLLLAIVYSTFFEQNSIRS